MFYLRICDRLTSMLSSPRFISDESLEKRILNYSVCVKSKQPFWYSSCRSYFRVYLYITDSQKTVLYEHVYGKEQYTYNESILINALNLSGVRNAYIEMYEKNLSGYEIGYRQSPKNRIAIENSDAGAPLVEVIVRGNKLPQYIDKPMDVYLRSEYCQLEHGFINLKNGHRWYHRKGWTLDKVSFIAKQNILTKAYPNVYNGVSGKKNRITADHPKSVSCPKRILIPCCNHNLKK